MDSSRLGFWFLNNLSVFNVFDWELRDVVLQARPDGDGERGEDCLPVRIAGHDRDGIQQRGRDGEREAEPPFSPRDFQFITQ